ncbi:MAG: adenine phosphoribosyltransferase [Actinomycetales bacterium]|nr:adenine phosphoribosyltransferase [Actinomycetales bacterium]
MSLLEAKSAIVEIADYPQPGVVFKDVTPVFANPVAFQSIINEIALRFADLNVTAVVGIEARGFILGGALANQMKVGFVPVRKLGKLPRETYSAEYVLEYGSDAIEIHTDSLNSSDHVLIVDDVLATGGTVNATIDVIEQTGAAVVGFAILLNLDFLGGADRIAKEHPAVRLVSLLD